MSDTEQNPAENDNNDNVDDKKSDGSKAATPVQEPQAVTPAPDTEGESPNPTPGPGSKPATPASASKQATPVPGSKPATPSSKPATPGQTSKPGSSRSARSPSKTGSKPGSAKSARSGSAKSGKSSGRRGSSPRAHSPKAKKLKKKAVAPDKEDVLPDGVIPLFLATQSQQIFECRVDEDVTEDEPFKLLKKEAILQDLFNRAAISDFAPIKQIIQNYPGVELLIGYDPDFKHGQNFYIATTEEAKNSMLHTESDEEGEVGVEGSQKASEENVVYKYIPPEPKDWVSLGSEREVEEESLIEHRKRIKMTVRRKRRLFGAPVEFVDRNVADAKDGFIECTPYEDKIFDLKTVELSKGTQAIPEFRESSAQTDWKFPRNAAVQYYPQEMTDEQMIEEEKKEEVQDFSKKIVSKFEVALQQNEIMDVFYDDWFNLSDGDNSFGSKADNHLKEYQSFTDLQFSKGRTITAIEWHPTARGIVAVAVAERMSFDERIDNAAKVIMHPSLILIWSFADPIHPQLLLEAPDDILSFKISPSDPNIICGGCINGQIVLWDISQYAERLKQPRSKRKDNKNSLPGFEDERSMETPIVRYCAVSSIENSHRAPVTDIQWLPDHMEVNRMGVPQENKSGQCCQVVSCGTDQLVLFWDTRPPKGQQQQQHEKQKDNMKNAMGVPDTFKHLDLTWKPMLKVNLHKSEPGGDHAPTKFSMAESHGDKSALNAEEENYPKKDASNTMAGGFSMGAVRTTSAKRTLQNIKTHFYVGTEDGEIVYVDWMPQKDQDSGKLQTPKPDYYHSVMDGPVTSLQRSPFFKDVVLCVGGWSFSLWKEGISSGPILNSAASNKRLTGGFWSPTRPAVFYITRQDGSVDIWDLLDRTHEPSMNQSVSPSPITCIHPFQVTNKQHLLAVGDHSGTLHILEIPWSLRQPTANEMQGVANYFEREVKRRNFVVARWDFREKEKMEIEAEIKRNAGIAPNVVLTEDEIEYRNKQEYLHFLEEETNFLRELGLKEDEPEPLPPTD